jgi:hypothetical protein
MGGFSRKALGPLAHTAPLSGGACRGALGLTTNQRPPGSLRRVKTTRSTGEVVYRVERPPCLERVSVIPHSDSEVPSPVVAGDAKFGGMWSFVTG